MGKLVAAFILFLGASALAIHESKPTTATTTPPPTPTGVEPTSVDHAPPSRAVHDVVPPWAKYAAPPATPPPEPPHKLVVRIETPRVLSFDSDSNDDVPDIVDRCPDQPTTGERDSEDGCPELENRIILVE